MDSCSSSQSTPLHNTGKLRGPTRFVLTMLLSQTSSSSDVIQKLLDTGLIPILVKLASKPTHVSKKWYLTDLEVRIRWTSSVM